MKLRLVMGVQRKLKYDINAMKYECEPMKSLR